MNTEREKEVVEELELLHDQLISLVSGTNLLFVSITPILRDGTPSVIKEQPIRQLCPLATKIRDYRFSVENLRERVQDAYDRVEV